MFLRLGRSIYRRYEFWKYNLFYLVGGQTFKEKKINNFENEKLVTKINFKFGTAAIL